MAAYYPLTRKQATTRLQSSEQDMIPGKNARDAHEQNFMANGTLLLPTLKAFPYCTLSLHATQNA